MFNLRDLGGYRVNGSVTRSGVLFRSSALVANGDDDVRALSDHGFRLAIDLREPGETATEPIDLTGDFTSRVYPLIDIAADGQPPTDLPAFNDFLLTRRADRLVDIVRDLAEMPGPAVYFCTTGKDRTGVVSALVLSAVGVSDDEVVRDYTRTEALIPDGYLTRWVERGEAAGMDGGSPADALACPPAVMEAFLAQLERDHGGATEFLLASGLEQAELDALRAKLVV